MTGCFFHHCVTGLTVAATGFSVGVSEFPIVVAEMSGTESILTNVHSKPPVAVWLPTDKLSDK